VLATAIWPVNRPANAVSSYRVSNEPGVSFAVTDSDPWNYAFALASPFPFTFADLFFISFDFSSFFSVISFCLALQKIFVKTHENRQFHRVLARIRTLFTPNASTDFIFRCATTKPLQMNVSQQLCHRRPATKCEPMRS